MSGGNEDASLLGAILVRRAGLSLRDLQAALDEQKKNREVHLGEILIEMGKISAVQLAEALQVQKQMREQ